MNFLKLLNNTGLIAAHRGANSLYPENTMSALVGSKGKCDFIEVDVALSSDRVAVIMHDDTLCRTTNVKSIESYKDRVPYKICNFTFEELRGLDYGSWFYDDIQNRYEPLLTLKDTLNFIKENKMFLNIEIKDTHKNFSDEDVVSIVLKEIIDSHTQNQVLISSFRAEYLPLCKKNAPEIPTALLVENKHPNNLMEYLKELQVDGYHFNDALVDKKTIKILKENGYFVNIYVVNDTTRAKELFEMGINGIFSDIITSYKRE